jgi:predicted phosphoadenosine phosphosulfate sulfurtransferase
MRLPAMSKIYLQQNVFDAALERIHRLYDEFQEIIVNVSGGKDSTVILNLTLRVAQERGRLPVNVLFFDQEAEWDCVIDHIRAIMTDPPRRLLAFAQKRVPDG